MHSKTASVIWTLRCHVDELYSSLLLASPKAMWNPNASMIQCIFQVPVTDSDSRLWQIVKNLSHTFGLRESTCYDTLAQLSMRRFGRGNRFFTGCPSERVKQLVQLSSHFLSKRFFMLLNLQPE